MENWECDKSAIDFVIDGMNLGLLQRGSEVKKKFKNRKK